MCEAFQHTVARHPGAVALRAVGGTVTVTWEQYAARVAQIAAGLAALGVRRGDTVALMMTNRPEFHLADTAAFHLGAVPFSVYNTSAPAQIAHLLADAGCQVAVCEEQFADRLLAVTGGTAVRHVVCVDGHPDGTLTLAELEAGGDPGFGFEAAWRAVAPGDLLTLVYTSGTTGPPKGVEITHAQMMANFQAPPVWPVPPGDRAVSYLPMAHIAERWFGHYGAMFYGIQITPVADVKALPGALQDVRPTIFGGVPRVFEKLKAGIEALLACEPDQAKRQATQEAFETGRQYVRASQAGSVPAGLADAHRRADEQVLAKIRALLGLDQVGFAGCGAAPVAPEVLEFMHVLGIPVAEAWGMSECAGVPIANLPGMARLGTVGKALPRVELKLAGDGELLVRGPMVMRGYRHDPAATAKAIDDAGWLHTGDLATIDADGYVTITGRKKELIINAAGKNISPANIENAVLAASLLIAHVIAIGDRRPYLTTLIVLDPDTAALFAAQHGIADPAPAALAAHPAVRAAVAAAVDTANGKLSRVEQIKRFAILPVFWEPGGDEITPTMKLKRAPIAAKYADIIESLYAAADEPAHTPTIPAKAQ